MDEITLKALAKINLGLDVVRRREDGYHEVRMIMQTIHLYDLLEIQKIREPEIQIVSNLSFLPVNENNLVYKAAKLLMDEFQVQDGLLIRLKKFIPVAAGMAGGSADAAAVLRDAEVMHATHISVVDKMLQDMLDLAERAGDASVEARALRSYQCILLGGAAANPKTLERAVTAWARVYASYGMTETSSQIANALVDKRFDGGMKLLSGYTVRVVDPDAEGFGKLAVRGPGVTAGYLNAHTPRTMDGFLLTGDTAAFENGYLYLRERTQDKIGRAHV